jgi:carboxypeptidase family protein
MLKKVVSFAAAFFLTLALLAYKTYGQAVYGSVVGTVTDSSGGAVANAKVTIINLDKAVNVTTTTNEAGNYEQQHLIVGVYDVRVEAEGFQAFVQKNVQVNVDAAAQVNATLAVGQVTETVEVTAAVPLLKTERTDVSTTFSQRAVEDLPIFNRNFTDFELLTPGTQKLGWQHASSENPQGSIQIMVNGQHFSGTSFQLDGTDNRDPILGIIVINPNLDGVTEARFLSRIRGSILVRVSLQEYGRALLQLHERSGSHRLF